MILDEPLTAMIPPPDLWGSTGYTANNNKVGLSKCNRIVIFQADPKNIARGLVIFQNDQKNVLRKERSRRRDGARFAQPGAKRLVITLSRGPYMGMGPNPRQMGPQYLICTYALS